MGGLLGSGRICAISTRTEPSATRTATTMFSISDVLRHSYVLCRRRTMWPREFCSLVRRISRLNLLDAVRNFPFKDLIGGFLFFAYRRYLFCVGVRVCVS